MKSNFVIFSEARTGSTALTSALNHQKDIQCFREIFTDGPAGLMDVRRAIKFIQPKSAEEWRRLVHFVSQMENLLGTTHAQWMKNKNEKFANFLNLASNLSDKKVFGYKFFEKHFRSIQNDRAYLNFLKKNDTKIIILERDNILLQYISLLTASKIECFSSSTWNKASKKVFQLNSVEIDYNEFIKYKERAKRKFKSKIKAAEDYGLKYILIKYEDFIGENFIKSFKKIFDFLDLNFQDFIDPRNDKGNILDHKKINIYKIEDKIINYTAFKKAAEDNNDIETLNFLRESSAHNV